MNRHQPSAFLTRPSFVLMKKERGIARYRDLPEVVNHAHGVFGPVPFIEPGKLLTGKGFAHETISATRFRKVYAVFDPAVCPRLRFGNAAVPTSGARLPLPLKRLAEATIHTARCDKFDQSGRIIHWHAFSTYITNSGRGSMLGSKVGSDGSQNIPEPNLLRQKLGRIDFAPTRPFRLSFWVRKWTVSPGVHSQTDITRSIYPATRSLV